MLARIAVEQAVLIGQNNQIIRLHQICRQRRQRIIIAKANFIDGHGVIFIHHRHHAQRQQTANGAARIQIAFSIREIIVSQQDLRGVPTVTGKAGLPGLNQPHLPHRRCRL